MCIFLRVKAGFPIRFWLGFVHTCSLLLLALLLLKFWWVNRTHKQAYNITIGSFIYKISGCVIHAFELYMAFKALIVFGTNVSCQWWYKYFNLKKKNFLRKNILPRNLQCFLCSNNNRKNSIRSYFASFTWSFLYQNNWLPSVHSLALMNSLIPKVQLQLSNNYVHMCSSTIYVCM